MNNYFDIKRDTATGILSTVTKEQPHIDVRQESGFFCEACLVGKPMDDQSPDPRYCLECFEILVKEAEMLTGKRNPPWVPRPQKIAPQKQRTISQYGGEIMSTLADKKITVDIIQPPGGKVTHKKRGPKHRELPVDLIKELAAEGFGAKVIAAVLKRRQGIVVSYKTVQRVLAGQRVMV